MLATGLFTKQDEAAKVMEELVSLRYTAAQLRFAFIVLLEQDAKPITLYKRFENVLFKDYIDRGLSLESARDALRKALYRSWVAQGNTDEKWCLKDDLSSSTDQSKESAPISTRITPQVAATRANALAATVATDFHQNAAATSILRKLRSNDTGMFFVHGKAGTGKSTLATYITCAALAKEAAMINAATTG